MSGRIVAVVPARNEADRVGDTVRALRSLVDEVVVVDDGSRDTTTSVALAAGATVLRIPGRAGKGAAVEGAVTRVRAADVWLFADADLGVTAAGLDALIEAVEGDGVDLAIAALGPQPGGGLGIVKGFAGWAIRTLGGRVVREPLSGQRAISAAALDRIRPFAEGFGLETAMTIDALRQGLRVEEIELPSLLHRPTGRSLLGFWHRGRQGWDIARALPPRLFRRR
jgi:glycosyltransferase involved in cell wall biosynthesis